MTLPTPIRAFYCAVQSQEIAANPTTGADTLPSGNIVAPGVYTIFGCSVDMTVEGLYRVSDFNGRSAQVISYASNATALLSSIAWLSKHGTNDLGQTTAALLSTARLRSISVDCGGMSNVAMALLAQTNLPARMVNGYTDGVLNAYDNSHTIQEIWLNDQWVAVDLDMKLRFYASDGVTALNALGLHDAVFNNQSIIFSPLIDSAGPVESETAYCWLSDNIRDQLYAWYHRMFTMPAHPNAVGGFDVMYENAAQQTAILAYGVLWLSPMDRADFTAKYYSKVHTGSIPDTTTGWGALYTIVDLTTQLFPGANIHDVGVYMNNPHSDMVVKIVRENSSTNYDVIMSAPAANHPGGGYFDFVLPSAFTVPEAGICRMGFSCNIPASPAEAFCSVGDRATAMGDIEGNSQTMSYRTDGTLGMRWTEA